MRPEVRGLALVLGQGISGHAEELGGDVVHATSSHPLGRSRETSRVPGEENAVRSDGTSQPLQTLEDGESGRIHLLSQRVGERLNGVRGHRGDNRRVPDLRGVDHLRVDATGRHQDHPEHPHRETDPESNPVHG